MITREMLIGGFWALALLDSKGYQGTSSSYLARRLLRDAPAIFDDLKAGRYRSVRAAAKEAGIVKDPTPYEALIKAWNKADELDRKRFIEFIRSEFL